MTLTHYSHCTRLCGKSHSPKVVTENEAVIIHNGATSEGGVVSLFFNDKEAAVGFSSPGKVVVD